MTCRVVDRAIQVHGAMEVCQDSPLAHFYAGARSLCIADIVHMETVAKEKWRNFKFYKGFIIMIECVCNL